jgi:hypothetical protein
MAPPARSPNLLSDPCLNWTTVPHAQSFPPPSASLRSAMASINTCLSTLIVGLCNAYKCSREAYVSKSSLICADCVGDFAHSTSQSAGTPSLVSTFTLYIQKQICVGWRLVPPWLLRRVSYPQRMHSATRMRPAMTLCDSQKPDSPILR